jgi:hypothetical protein
LAASRMLLPAPLPAEATAFFAASMPPWPFEL